MISQIVTFLCVLTLIECRGLRLEFSWSRINYEWPNWGKVAERDSYHAITFPGNTNYKPEATTPKSKLNDDFYTFENNIPMGANVWGDKLFITVPRRRVGIPSSLNFVWLNSTKRDNLRLIPYPDWETNLLSTPNPNQNKIVSVYRVAVDRCDRLWFVDTGRIEELGEGQNVQPAAIVIMDLKTNRIIKRHIIPDGFLRPASNLASITLDIDEKDCEKGFAYIPDLGGFSMIVYHIDDDKSWRVNHNYFSFEPLAGDLFIGGQHFQWNDGIFSIALSARKSDGYRDAYFHSMSGFNQYRVSTRILQNETAATRSFHEADFKFIGSKGPLCQTSASDLDQSRGILFLGLISRNALGCWDIDSPLSDSAIVQKNDKTMIYPTDVKISNGNLIVLTNGMPIFLYGSLNYTETNFRVWIESIETAIAGTNCAKKQAARKPFTFN